MTTTKKDPCTEPMVSADKATPGPWVVALGDDWTAEYPRDVMIMCHWRPPINGCGGYGIAKMVGVNDHTMPNAKLIAAAPQLLEALKNARRFIVVNDPEMIGYVDGLIARVEGREDR